MLHNNPWLVDQGDSGSRWPPFLHNSCTMFPPAILTQLTHSFLPADGNIFAIVKALITQHETWEYFYSIARLEITGWRSTCCGAPQVKSHTHPWQQFKPVVLAKKPKTKVYFLTKTAICSCLDLTHCSGWDTIFVIYYNMVLGTLITISFFCVWFKVKYIVKNDSWDISRVQSIQS